MKTELKSRTYDGQFVVWGMMPDPTFQSEKPEEKNAAWIYQRWVILGVHESLDNAKKQVSTLIT